MPRRRAFKEDASACPICGRRHLPTPCDPKVLALIDAVHAAATLEQREYYHPNYHDRLRDGFAMMGDFRPDEKGDGSPTEIDERWW